MTTAEPAIQSRHSTLEALLILLGSRVGLLILAYLGLSLMNAPPKDASAIPGNLFFDGWTRWDGGWYARLARDGYTNLALPNSEQRDIGQFPLYPWLIRYSGKLLGGDVYLAGILVSNVSFVVAGLLLYRLIANQWTPQIARRAIVLWSVYPFSYTFSAVYTESLFVLCAIGAFACASRQQWLAVGVCAALAGATRFVGTATVFALYVAYFLTTRQEHKSVRFRDLIGISIGLLGVVGFSLMLAIRFGEPFGFIHVHGAGGWGDFNSWNSLLETFKSWRSARFGSVASGNVPLLNTIHFAMIVLAATACVVATFRFPLEYTVWMVLVVVASMMRWACFGRHFATVFPAFIVGAIVLKNDVLYRSVVFASTLLLALLTLLFTQGYWVA